MKRRTIFALIIAVVGGVAVGLLCGGLTMSAPVSVDETPISPVGLMAMSRQGWNEEMRPVVGKPHVEVEWKIKKQKN